MMQEALEMLYTDAFMLRPTGKCRHLGRPLQTTSSIRCSAQTRAPPDSSDLQSFFAASFLMGPRQIREQVPAAFVEAAKTFTKLASAAAEENGTTLRSFTEDLGRRQSITSTLRTTQLCSGLGSPGMPWPQLAAALDASATMLTPLYTAVPRKGSHFGLLLTSLHWACLHPQVMQ